MPHVAVTALSHVGRIRDHNEDSLVVGPWTLRATVTDRPQTLVFGADRPLVVAVADGLGGHAGGEVASGIVVDLLARADRSLSDAATVAAAVRDCNAAVYAAAADDPTLEGMGTTVAGLVAGDGEVIVFNVGDSRVYRLDDAGLEQVSTDDSPPLEPGQRSTSVVLQTLGGYDAAVSVRPHVTEGPLRPGQRWLLATDGLTDLVDDADLARLLHDHAEDDAKAAVALWQSAMDAGGDDNITLALVRPTG